MAEDKAKADNENRKNMDDTAKAMKKINESNERTTLGDLETLSNLKNAMEAEERK